MPKTSRRTSALALALIALAALAGLFGRRVLADESVTVQVRADFELSPAGDGKARMEIVFGAAIFPTVKERTPDPRKFLQDMAPDRADYEMTDASARYDDAATSVVLEMVERAAGKNLGGGRWELEPEAGATLERTTEEGAARPTAWFKVKGDWGGGVLYEGSYVCRLPAGAKELRWDDARKVLAWRLDAKPGEGEARLSADLRARDRLMATVYKVYGLGTDVSSFWLAKTVFKNEGQGVVRNLRVRYRLQGYGEWSPWEKHAELVPGQTVVSVHYPVLDAAIAKLKSNTPANVLLEYSFEDAAGKKHEDDGSKKIVLLGVNEFVFGNLTEGQSFGTWQEAFNNAPLLAAWVSRNDGAVKQFAAMANRMAGGVGASTDDASALRVLAACYELLRKNDFTYQHPPSLTDRSVSFDVKGVQNVKFPRETMRDRSGTCIDLAILYAAMVNAVGLEPHLALIPGHCFPIVKLPSGRFVGVETTGVQGGLKGGSAPFERVQPYGDEEYAKAQKDGRLYDVDVRSLWTRGIANPEMEDLPADILERWGLTEAGRGTPAGSGEAPGPGAPAGEGLDAALGLWGGAFGTKVEGGTLDAFVLGVDKTADGYAAATRADVTLSKDGGERKVVLVTRYKGVAKGDAILFESTSRTRTVDGGPAVELVQAFLLVRPKAGHVEARVGNDAEGYSDLTLVSKRDGPAPAEAAAAGGAEAVRGSWGGDMSAAKLGTQVVLDELYVDVPADGAWRATVKMKVTVKTAGGGVKAVIDATYAGGRVQGDGVHWEKVAWHRTVPSTGQKNDIDGNPLLLKVLPDGRLSGVFEGDDGWTFTLARRGAAPATPAAPGKGSALDAAAGLWGGEMHQAVEGGVLESLVVGIDKADDGTYAAASHAVLTVKNDAGETLRLVAIGRYVGKASGDKIVFTSTSRTVGLEGSAETKDLSPGSLEVTPVDGKIRGRLGNDDDGWTTFTLPPKKD